MLYRFFVLAGLVLALQPIYAAEPSSESETSHYWDGNRLNNLKRLGQAYEGFENTTQQQRDRQKADEYLIQTRDGVARDNAARRGQGGLGIEGSNPDTALQIVTVEKGYLRVFLRSSFLFDENQATFKTGAIDVLDRVSGLLERNTGSRVEITLINDLQDMPNARDIDAGRALAVFGHLGIQ